MRELEQLSKRSGLRQRAIELELDDTLLDWLTVNGYDPQYGARFLRRTIERNVSTALARLLVQQAPTAGTAVTLEVHRNRVRARMIESATTAATRAPVALLEGTNERVKSLDRARLLAEAEQVVAAARPLQDRLVAHQEEHSRLLEQVNAVGFWDHQDNQDQVLARFRALDVAIQIERRLAASIEQLDRQYQAIESSDNQTHFDLAPLAQCFESAQGSLDDWRIRTEEEGAAAIWLVVSDFDPLARSHKSWTEALTIMELAWARRLGLEASVVAYAEHEDHVTCAAIEIEGPGAEHFLAMESGIHRRVRREGRALRSRVEVVPRGAGAAPWPTSPHRLHKGKFGLRLGTTGTLSMDQRGHTLKLAAADSNALGHLLSDLNTAWAEPDQGIVPERMTEVARVYGEDGKGAVDPRTGAVVARPRDVTAGHLDRLLEAWRRRTAAVGNQQ